jgi:hypothetical protein
MSEIEVKARKPRKKSNETRCEGRWRLDFSRKDRGLSSEPVEERRKRIKQWLQHNYPHVLRQGGEDGAEK